MTTPVCSGGNCVDPSEARGLWSGGGGLIFDRAAHFVGFDSDMFTMQDAVTGSLENSAWYHLAMVLNTGYRDTMPSHFPYTLNWIDNLARDSGVVESFRFWATYIKMRQLQTNGRYGTEPGLDLRTAQPFFVYSDESGRTSVREGVGPDHWRHLSQALIEDLIADASNATNADWAAANQNSVVQAEDSTDIGPCDECFDSTSKPRPFQVPGPYQGRNTYRVIPRLRTEVGVEEPVLDSSSTARRPGRSGTGTPSGCRRHAARCVARCGRTRCPL